MSFAVLLIIVMFPKASSEKKKKWGEQFPGFLVETIGKKRCDLDAPLPLPQRQWMVNDFDIGKQLGRGKFGRFFLDLKQQRLAPLAQSHVCLSDYRVQSAQGHQYCDEQQL